MTCTFYERHAMGELDEQSFQTHVKDCGQCQKTIARDTKLLSVAKMLNQPVRAPLLWAKIENQIRNEKTRSLKWRPAKENQWPQILRLAAVILIAFGIGVGSYIFLKSDPEESQNILAANALKRVEKVEQDYFAAIAELEAAAAPQMDQMNIEIVLLYRDRLATVDAQIQRCRDALAVNPGNAHIRRYLLAALQDKKETLSQIIEADASML